MKPLPRRRIGNTNVEVTELGFGGSAIGNLRRPTDPDTAAAAVEEAWRSGIRYFDTAPHYGLGLSERRLGDALRDRPRDDYIISTKVGRLLVPNPNPSGSDLDAEDGGFAVPDDLTRQRDYGADGARKSIDESLHRLGLDRIDIALVHDPDDHLHEAVDGAIPALIALRDQGVIDAVGVGMNQWQAPLRILEAADIDVIMVAGRWTLLDRSARPLLDRCHDRNVGVLAAAPFNSGLLSRVWPNDHAPFDYHPAPNSIMEQVRRLAELCRQHAVELPQAALQFPLRHPAVASVVTGLRSPQQVQSTIESINAQIPEALWERLASLDNAVIT
jgi:D-threo-aldose 1-dehydrogenase